MDLALRDLSPQAIGALFEKMFYNSCNRHHITATRMPDGCRQLGFKKLIRVKTPWDWILTSGGVTALIDTKTVTGDTFNHSNIKDHQVEEMIRHEIDGAIAGYVIWVRETDKIFFVQSSHLVDMMRVRGTIKPDDPKAILLGGYSSLNPKLIWSGHGKA